MKREDQISRTTERLKGEVVTARSAAAHASALRGGVCVLHRIAMATGWETGASTSGFAEEGGVAGAAVQHGIAAMDSEGAWADSHGASAACGQHRQVSMDTTRAAGSVRDTMANAMAAVRPFMR